MPGLLTRWGICWGKVIFNATYFMVRVSLSNWVQSHFTILAASACPGLCETQILTKTGRPWNEMRRPGVEFHVVGFNGWIKVRNLNGWNKIFNKGEMSKNPDGYRRYICTVLLCPWRNMDRRKWTPNLVYQRILKLETGGRRVGLAMSGQMCLFLLKFNQSLFLCISDSMRFFLFGFEDIFIFLRVAILLNSVVGKKIVLSENLLV